MDEPSLLRYIDERRNYFGEIGQFWALKRGFSDNKVPKYCGHCTTGVLEGLQFMYLPIYIRFSMVLYCLLKVFIEYCRFDPFCDPLTM